MNKVKELFGKIRDRADTDKDGHVSRVEAEQLVPNEIRAHPWKSLAVGFAGGFGTALLLVGLYLVTR